MRSQSCPCKTPRSRGKAWERRQLLVKAEIQVLVQHPRRLIRQSQAEGFTLRRKEVVEDGRRSSQWWCPRTGRCSGPEETEWPGLPW